MCKVFCVGNQKGGVGKTTSTVNLGIGLAKLGNKVLCVDADSQGNLSVSLGIAEQDSFNYTLADILRDTINEVEIGRKGILHHEEGIDFIPANTDLSDMEVQLINTIGRETILRQYVEQIKSYYDYIIIDCSPNLGMITINAITCADSVVIPVQASYLPLKGLRMLIKTIMKIKRQLNPKLNIEGILITMVDAKKIPFNMAVELSYLKENEQQILCTAMIEYETIPSMKQAARLKNFSKQDKLDKNVIDAIMTEETETPIKINLTGKNLKKYFPKEYTQKQMEDVIYKLLEDWAKNN